MSGSTSEAVRHVDVGALTAAIRGIAVSRSSSMIVSTLTQLAECDNALNEKQAAALVESGLYFFDGFERACAELIVADLKQAGVDTWGLLSDLADLEGRVD